MPSSEQRPRLASLRRAAVARGESALRALVASGDERRIERIVGSGLGLRIVFGAMAARFDPAKAGGFTGDVRYELRGDDDRVRTWTVTCRLDGATAVAGPQPDPAVTVKVGIADFARIATGELDPGVALLRRKLDIAGNFLVAARLGAMFGAPSPAR